MWPTNTQKQRTNITSATTSSRLTSATQNNNNGRQHNQQAPHSLLEDPQAYEAKGTGSRQFRVKRNKNRNNAAEALKIIAKYFAFAMLAMTFVRILWLNKHKVRVEGYDRDGNKVAAADVGEREGEGSRFERLGSHGLSSYATAGTTSASSTTTPTESMWTRATNGKGKNERVKANKLAAGLLVDHIGRALAPAVAKYVDMDEDGQVDAQEFESFANRVGGVENVAKGFTSAVLAALEKTWGESEGGGHNKPIEKTPCAIEFNRALQTGAELEVTSDVQFKGVKPFCVEAWVKPSDAETTRNGFHGYGGAIFAKKSSDAVHPDDDDDDDKNDLVKNEKEQKVGAGQFTIALDDAGGLTFMRETGLTTALRSKRHLKPNSYTHIAASYGFGDASIFINGTLDATRKEGAILRSDDITPLTIGMLLDRKGRSSLGFTGTIQEVRLWSRPCDKESMKRYYERRLVGWEPGLTAYWPMNDCFGKILQEKRGEYRGRVTGRATWRRNGHHLMTDDDIELCKHLAKGVIDESLV
jgi:hypothetical protein